MRVVEVAIIGGGVNGSSIAYHLAQAGVKVAVIDRAEPAVEPSASWASAGGVRQQRRDPREWGLTIEASKRWPTLTEELDGDVEYVQGGHLHIIEHEADRPALEQRVTRERAAGMNIRILTGAELRAVAPSLNDQVIAGAYTVEDGQANPPKTTRAWAAAAQRLGADYLIGEPVRRLVVERDRVVGLATASMSIAADWVICVAGAWSGRILATAGFNAPIRPRAPQMLLSDAASPKLKPTITGTNRQLSLKQLPTGEFFIGGGWPSAIWDDGETLHCAVRQTSIVGSWAVASAVLPDVAKQRVARAWCGLEAQAFDDVPFIGPTPWLPGLYLAIGFSGHGFQISPAVGRNVAAQLLGQPTPALEPLTPNRLLGFDRAAVAAFQAETTGAMAPGTLG